MLCYDTDETSCRCKAVGSVCVQCQATGIGYRGSVAVCTGSGLCSTKRTAGIWYTISIGIAAVAGYIDVIAFCITVVAEYIALNISTIADIVIIVGNHAVIQDAGQRIYRYGQESGIAFRRRTVVADIVRNSHLAGESAGRCEGIPSSGVEHQHTRSTHRITLAVESAQCSAGADGTA